MRNAYLNSGFHLELVYNLFQVLNKRMSQLAVLTAAKFINYANKRINLLSQINKKIFLIFTVSNHNV